MTDTAENQRSGGLNQISSPERAFLVNLPNPGSYQSIFDGSPSKIVQPSDPRNGKGWATVAAITNPKAGFSHAVSSFAQAVQNTRSPSKKRSRVVSEESLDFYLEDILQNRESTHYSVLTKEDNRAEIQAINRLRQQRKLSFFTNNYHDIQASEQKLLDEEQLRRIMNRSQSQMPALDQHPTLTHLPFSHFELEQIEETCSVLNTERDERHEPDERVNQEGPQVVPLLIPKESTDIDDLEISDSHHQANLLKTKYSQLFDSGTQRFAQAFKGQPTGEPVCLTNSNNAITPGVPKHVTLVPQERQPSVKDGDDGRGVEGHSFCSISEADMAPRISPALPGSLGRQPPHKLVTTARLPERPAILSAQQRWSYVSFGEIPRRM